MPNNLNKHYTSQIDFNLSNDSWTVGKSAVISSADYGLYGSIGYENIDVTVKGKIWADKAAIYSEGDNVDVVVESTGLLSGSKGISLYSDDSSINNAGTILGDTGIDANGNNIKISNTGLVNGAYSGIELSYPDDALVNGKTGEVRGSTYGVVFSGASSGEATRTVNHGLIAGDTYSFASSICNDKLINDGKMIGNIDMGEGNDTLDTRGGTINGQIIAGAGDDKLYTDKASHKLTENAGEGTDSVYSTVSYKLSDNVENLYLIGKKDVSATGTALRDLLHGNSGDNVIKGLAGSDSIWGHKGNDKLYGGAGIDTFHFATGDGKDVIVDFEDNADVIDVADWAAIASFSDLRNNHATNQGSDLLLHAGSDSILIKNFHKSQLDASDVFFGA